jgi:hypothetical protein
LEDHSTPIITDEYIVQMHARAKPYSLLILKSGEARHQDGSATILREHEREMYALRVQGLLSIVCPVSDGGELDCC